MANIQIERERWERQRRILVSENVAALGRLAAVLSHEFNSPLGALRSTVDTLVRISARKELASPADRLRLAAVETQLRGTMDTAIDRMNHVISRIQRFTNLDRAEIQSVNLNELLRDIIALSEAQSSDKSVEVQLACESLPPVTCRPQQLNLVFSSLLSNAVEACRQTGDRAGRIRVSTKVRDSMIEVQLEDNGRGMPSGKLSH
ncbi:MAG: HAMP domain-containing histidine kinase, partial [bacterium]|nr:HAMP domain-containing histidine kinase [bacterium]